MDGDTTNSSEGPQTYKPDEVIRPQTGETPAPETPQPAQPPPADAPAEAPVSEARPFPETPGASSFAVDQTLAAADGSLPDAVTWTASEFIAHEKAPGWYGLLALGAVAAAAVVWLFTRDVLPTSGVFIGILLLAYYASRQPRQQRYRLDASGLTIGDRHLPYQEFRSFAVVPEGAFLSIELTPLKRFAMYTAVYLDPKDEDRILSYLSAHLPMAEARSSLTDDLMRRIHF